MPDTESPPDDHHHDDQASGAEGEGGEGGGGGGERGGGERGKDGQNKLSSVQTGPPTLSKLSQLSLLCFPLDIPFPLCFHLLLFSLTFHFTTKHQQ